ncbi:hypothetical protein Tco_0252285 [Tanacetum coccineum]
MDRGSRNGLLANERVDSRIFYQCRPDDRKRPSVPSVHCKVQKSQEKEELIIYMVAAKEAISAVLMTERDGNASKRLKRYFQAHTVIVITDQQIKQMISNPEVTGRLLKWSFELGEHDIQYRPRTSVKGQILADFIVERPEDNSEDKLMEDAKELPDPWILFTDGSSCTDGSGA